MASGLEVRVYCAINSSTLREVRYSHCFTDNIFNLFLETNCRYFVFALLLDYYEKYILFNSISYHRGTDMFHQAKADHCKLPAGHATFLCHQRRRLRTVACKGCGSSQITSNPYARIFYSITYQILYIP